MISLHCFYQLLLFLLLFFFFFFNDTATTEIYTLSLHDALPIFRDPRAARARRAVEGKHERGGREHGRTDRKSTRLNSSHPSISYAVFCLKKKKKKRKRMCVVDGHDGPVCSVTGDRLKARRQRGL